MRVLVTGGTGFVGSHAVASLRAAGHQVRMLVRSRERIAPALGPHGLSAEADVEVEVGDVTDRAAVARALQGCDAVVHAANVYSMDVRRAEEMRSVNPRATENVLGLAAEAGLDPIVHVSSTVALLPSGGATLTPESPLGSPPGAYAASKVAAERVARRLAEGGAPLVVVSPGAVYGPNDPHLGEFSALMVNVLRGRVLLLPPGITPVADVRDVAAVLTAVTEPGRGARRYLVSGGHLRLDEVVAEARRLTGRRLPAATAPARLVLAGGRAADRIQPRLPVRLPVYWEGPWLATQSTPVDASAVTRDLGVALRPPRESVADTVRWLCASGHVPERSCGSLARPAT